MEEWERRGVGQQLIKGVGSARGGGLAFRSGGIGGASGAAEAEAGRGAGDKDFVFVEVDRFGRPRFGERVKYGSARRQLIREQARLGLEGLTLHSGRIGGATEAAEAGVGRAAIKEQGGWESEAVDVYIRAKRRGREVTAALVEGLRF